jgi:hypothetical protein
MLGVFFRCPAGFANGGAELVKFALCTIQLAINNLQTHDEWVNVDTSCVRNSIWYFDGWLPQYLKNALSIYAADAMLLEQLINGWLAQLCGFGWCRSPEPKIKKPSGGDIISELQHLGVIPPELLMEAIAQPNPFLLQLLGKARPGSQFDQTGVGNLEATEQMPVGTQTISWT